ncbi:hypothetical protein CRG98_031034 [Punica granatum]|nr:hypothetical protein CRG98_031034 [Punica granatum]
MDVVEGEEEVEEAQLAKFVGVVRRNIQSDPEDNTWIEKVLDPRLRGHYSKRQARALVEVGIVCVEEDRSKRPTMDNIVDVLLECDNEPNVPAR